MVGTILQLGGLVFWYPHRLPLDADWEYISGYTWPRGPLGICAGMSKIEIIAGFLLIADFAAIVITVAQYYLAETPNRQTFGQSIAFLVDIAIVICAIVLVVRISRGT